MEIDNENQETKELKSAEAITVSNNDFTQQNEIQPNPNDGPEVTTTLRNPSEEGGTKEQRPDNNLRLKEPSPNPQRQVPDSVPTEPAPTTLREEDNTETNALPKRTNEAPTDITSSSVHGERTEPRDEDSTETDAPAKRTNEAPTDITSSPMHGERTEPNILDILGDE